MKYMRGLHWKWYNIIFILFQDDFGEFNQCQAQLAQLYESGLKGHQTEFMSYRLLYLLFTKNFQGSALYYSFFRFAHDAARNLFKRSLPKRRLHKTRNQCVSCRFNAKLFKFIQIICFIP